ncbi:MAG: choice-of-anchor L domain-containing protein [Saprospiraceae bacterium]
MRAPLTLPKGISTVQICGLEPGNSYKLIAVPMAYGQIADFEIAPAPALSKGTSSFAYVRESKQAVSFAAPSACVEIQIKTNSTEQDAQIPMYLSIRCESSPEAKSWLQKVGAQADQAILQVQSGFSAEELVKDVLVGGGCFQISNVSYSGQGEQIGTFSNGSSNIGFSNGLIMATGNIIVAPGPNVSDGASAGYGIGSPDADLATLATGTLFDMANIEFDFVPTENQVVFEFVFASEEYCEYVNTQFNDVFGFFISGPGISGTKNIALIPTTNTPVTINTVNHLVNSGLYTHNTPFIGQNCNIPPAFGPAVIELAYDGFTKKLIAIADVVPCQTYHIKLKIADVGDGVWDSAVFFRANSFDAGGTVLASPAYPGGSGSSYESCDAGSIRFQRGGGSNINLPQPITFSVAGSATPGVDYVPITGPVIIPAGQSEILVPITVLPDFISEGEENILVTIPNACSCSQGTVEFLINDHPPFSLSFSGTTVCQGDTAILMPTVATGLMPYSYHWNTGESTSSIATLIAGTYSVTVKDGCGVGLGLSAPANFILCNTDCDAETFIKTIGEIGQNVRGYGIYDSQDGNLYITGLKQDSAVLIKMTPTGTVLWMRTFDVEAGSNDNISELIVDSEGMLVGCGQSGDLQPGISGFVFRYNPTTNNMQWINTYSLESAFVIGLMELPNGNYLIYDNPHNPPNDNRMLEITRPDGTIDFSSPLSQKLNLGAAENFNGAVLHNNKLYGVGRYTNGNDFEQMRHALSRIDLTTGNVDWTRLSHVPANLPARLYGMDLLIEDNHIISVSYGDETGIDLNNNQVFLQKTELNGNLIWVKRFDLLETANELVEKVISVPDGFVLYIRSREVPSDLYLMKTNKAGELQWSKKVEYGLNDFVGSVISIYQSQMLMKDNHLFFIASIQESGSNGQMLVAKTKMDGSVEGNCDFIKPTLVETSDVTTPANFAVILQELPFDEQTITIIRTPTATNLQVENQCKVLVNDSIDIKLCFGESVNINGVSYSQDTTFSIEIPGNGGCDTLRTYIIDVLPLPMQAVAIALCPGDFVIIGGQIIDHAGTFILSLDGTNGACDTIVTYTITSVSFQTRSEDISLCPGKTVTIGGQVYNQSGTVIDTISASIGCDTIVTYTLTLLPYQTRSESISFCPGETVTIGGQVYNQLGTVIDTIPSLVGCDTIVTYTLTLLSQPTRSETISFCPGETITLGGTSYTQPGTVILTLASSTGGCDTIATYTLQFSTPAPSNVIITCPSAITINQPGGSGGAVVHYNAPTASTDCTCPGIALIRTSGLPSGSTFPTGTTAVCFQAIDSCGQSATCCFNITIGVDDPCDTKTASCIKYELLTITEDMGKNRTYRVRVTNNCPNKLIYTAIQVPDGLLAMEPANLSTYAAPSGNTYLVRNPNFSPQYSIRYSSISDSINNGESDIFKYTLPAQADVVFIHVVSRLAPYLYLGAHLNTFYCPIGVTVDDTRPSNERGVETIIESGAVAELFLFPNPTSGELFADFSPWHGQSLNIQVLDSRGQRVQHFELTAVEDAQAINLLPELPSGLYFLEVLTAGGEKHTGRFVIQR